VHGGSWLPEEKKANIWHGRGNSGGSWPPAFPLDEGNYVLTLLLGQTLPVILVLVILYGSS